MAATLRVALKTRHRPQVAAELLHPPTLAAVTDPDDRHVLHRYAVWHHLRRLRARAAATGVSYGQAVHLQSLITAASAFLELLTRHDLTLATCGQPDLDRWLSRNQVPYRLAAGAFVRWATANKLAHLEFPATRWPGPTGPIDADQRSETARRLLHDDTLPVATRVAGLFVVLYAQRVTHIARLTVDDVATTGDRVGLVLGSVPVTLPDPMTRLVAELVATRRGHAVSGDSGKSRWLFPGGQPGRPISGRVNRGTHRWTVTWSMSMPRSASSSSTSR